MFGTENHRGLSAHVLLTASVKWMPVRKGLAAPLTALKIIAAWILNVLVPRPATNGGTETVGQHSGLVDLREW